MYFYAQLENGVCTAVTQASQPLIGPQFVQLDFLDFSKLGQTYGNGVWQ